MIEDTIEIKYPIEKLRHTKKKELYEQYLI